MEQRTIRWAAVAALIWRTLIMTVILLLSLSWTTRYPALIVVSVAVILANAFLLFATMHGQEPLRLLMRPWFFLADVSLTVALNLWASAEIRRGSLYAGYPWHDLFFPYVWGTVALWTGIRGISTGIALILLAAGPLQWAMTSANHFSFAAGLPGITDRDSWLVATFALTLGATYLSRKTAEAVAVASQQSARAELLRTMHDSALQTLEGIALQAGTAPIPDERLRRIEAAARQQAGQLRLLLNADGAQHHEPGSLSSELLRLAQDLRAGGLSVEVTTSGLDHDPPPPAVLALTRATREALTNVAKHAGTSRAVVRAARDGDAVRVTVRDHGCGFDPDTRPMGFGLKESMAGRLRELGGGADIWSAPGRGTKVSLWIAL